MPLQYPLILKNLQFLCLPIDVNGLWKLFQASILKNEGVRAIWISGPCRVTELFHAHDLECLSCLPFYIDDFIVRLKYHWLFRLKTTWELNINIVWHVSMNFTDTIWIFRLPVVTAFEPVDYWRKHANKMDVFGYIKRLYWTKGTFIE